MKMIMTMNDALEAWRAAMFFTTVAIITSMEAYRAVMGDVKVSRKGVA